MDTSDTSNTPRRRNNKRSTEQKNVPIDVLLTSPFCWKSEKICNFLHDAYNNIKLADSDLPVDGPISEFYAKLNSAGNNQALRPWSTEQWKDKISTNHYNIFMTFYEQGNITTDKEIKLKNKVSSLLSVIRNKQEHCDDLTENDKEISGWYELKNQKWTFNKTLFAKYWTENFPFLVVFVWWKFQELLNLDVASLNTFYIQKFESSEYIYKRLINFNSQFFTGLLTETNKGEMRSRFKMSSSTGDSTLEFRTIADKVLHHVLSDSTICIMRLLHDSVKIQWYEFDHPNRTFILVEERQTKLRETINSQKVAIFLATGLLTSWETQNKNTLGQPALAYILKPVIDAIQLINFCAIFVSNDYFAYEKMEIFESLAKQIGLETKSNVEENPLEINKLFKSIQKDIENKGKIIIQGRKIDLGHLLPEFIVHGVVLNQLIKQKQASIFSKHEIPENKGIYISRRIFGVGKVNARFFLQEQDVIHIVMNIKFDEFLGILPSCRARTHLLENLHEIYHLRQICSGPKVIKIFLLETYFSKYELESVLVGRIIFKNITCFRYVRDKTGCSRIFEWVYTKARLFSISHSHAIASSKVKLLNEYKFLHRVIANYERAVFISDVPGMGKSYVLISLAKKIASKYPNRLVLFSDLKDFVSKIDCCNSNEVTATIRNICCSTNFENELVMKWLEIKNSCSIKFEIFFDGLDEIYAEERGKALSILQFIFKSFPSVRFWATVRDYMQNEIRLNFNTLGYKLQPFSEHEQTRYLQRHWIAHCAKEHKQIPNSTELKEFAKQCLNIPRNKNEYQIAGIPLQCKMIAKINEEKVCEWTEGKSKLGVDTDYSLNNLYKQFLQRKMTLFLHRERIDKKSHVVDFVHQGVSSTLVYYGVQLIFSPLVATTYIGTLFLEPTQKSANAIIDHGVVKSTTPILFNHRTYAEYIVADFIHKILQNPNGQLIKSKNKYFQEFLRMYVLGVNVTSYIVSRSYQKPQYVVAQPNICAFLHSKISETFIESKYKEFMNGLRYSAQNYYLCPRNMACLENSPILVHLQGNSPLVLLASMKLRKELLVLSLLQNYTFHIAIYLMRTYDELSPSQVTPMKNCKHGNGVIHWVIYGLRHNHELVECILGDLKNFMSYLVENKRELLEEKDIKGKTPLLFFLTWVDYFRKGYLDICDIFVKDLKANVNAVDDCGNTVLHCILSITNRNVLKRYKNYKTNTLNSCSNALEYFLKRCSENTIDRQNNAGETPLMRMINHFSELGEGLLDVFEKYKADFNTKRKDGNTALHLAILKKSSANLIKKMIRLGADPDIKNSKGKTPRDLALAKSNLYGHAKLFKIPELYIRKKINGIENEEKKGKAEKNKSVNKTKYKKSNKKKIRLK